MPMDSIMISGNATRDPELKFTQSGRALCRLGVAVNRRKFNKDTSQWEDGETTWYDVTCWGDLGEHVAESITKGDPVFVAGRMSRREYQANDGTQRVAWELIAEAVGPDLNRATCSVQRATRNANGGGGASAPRAAANVAAPAGDDFFAADASDDDPF